MLNFTEHFMIRALSLAVLLTSGFAATQAIDVVETPFGLPKTAVADLRQADELFAQAESFMSAGSSRKALPLYEKAAALGHKRATYKAAVIYYAGSTSDDLDQAVEYLKICCEDFAEAAVLLGQICETVEYRNIPAALELYKLASDINPKTELFNPGEENYKRLKRILEGKGFAHVELH